MDHKLYGVCHDRDSGDALIRVPRVLKVSIGLPGGTGMKCPDKHVYIDRAGKWVLQTGSVEDKKRKVLIKTFDTMEQCQSAFLHAEVAERYYPVRLPYFTFTKPGHDGTQWPDWDAIKQHGPLPTAIPVIMVEDDPLSAEYQLWSSSELRCHGNGREAQRLVTMDPEQREAKRAKAEGKRRFPIVDGCATKGCPFYALNLPIDQQKKKGADCKPHGELRFQLTGNLMLGGTAYYVTTGKRSIVNLYSCLEQFKAVTGGRVAGVQMMLVMAPYRTKTPDGKNTTQYAVHLEFRADQAAALRSKLLAATEQFYASGIVPQAPQLGPGAPPAVAPETPIPIEGQPVTEKAAPGEEDFAAETAQAAAFTSEFTSGGDDAAEDFTEHGDGEGTEQVKPIDTIIDPTLAGQMYGAGKAKFGWNRGKTDQEFHDFLASDGGDMDKAKIAFMKHLEMIGTGATVEEPAAKGEAQQSSKIDPPDEYER